MVNSESMGSTGDGKQPKDYITQLNSGVAGGISVDTHSPSPVTASSVRLREMDYDANESAADVTSAECANPADSLPEAAVTRSIDDENFRLTNTVTSQTDAEVSSLYCSVPLNKVQDVLSSYSAESDPIGDAKTKKLLPRRLLCLYCDRTFVTSNLRSKHVERCHSVKQARRSSSRFQSRCPTACSFCRKLNNTDHDLNDLFRHLVEKHSNKYFACVPCEERFVFKTHLEEHNLRNHESFKDESSACNGAIPSQDYPTEDATEINTVKTKHRTKIKKESSEFDEEEATRPNLRMSVRKELRKKKVGVKSTKAGVKRNTRLQTKVTNAQTKSANQRKRTKTRNEKANKEESSEKSSTSVNPYPTFDAYFRVKKITDHSIDNLKISSLTFDDVFDKAFYTRIKCNIQENLQNHIDGKLFKNEESESRISNFEKNQELNSSPAENFGCDISLNAATPVVSLLSSQLGEDLESQIEYGAKASKKKPPPKKDEVHYKYFTRRKYQASILENKENRDLSKLDMWTQLVVKDRQQKIINDNKSEKEKIEYTKGIEYRTKMQNVELNRILDRRGPFEDLKEEANKKAAIEKYNNRLGENISCEAISDVTSILNDLIDRTFDLAESAIKTEVDEKTAEQIKLQLSDRDCEIPFYLCLRRNSSLIDQPDIDKSDRITLICSSQETENFEESAAPRDKNTLVELTGEWTRTRIYICAACGVKVPNMKQLIDHKSVYHQNVWVQHYEFVGNQSVLYRHLSIPGLGKVGLVEQCPMSKLWKRSDARLCTKCSKMCNTLGELHRHMLECGEDWSWMLARKKMKYRPFGAKSRRKRRGLVKRIIHKEKSGDEVRQKRKYNIKKYDGPRPKPSDAETIQRMLANLPAKRATRKLISLKDGFPKQIRRKPQQQTQGKSSNNAKNVAVKKKASVSSLNNQSLKGNKPRKRGRKCNTVILRKSMRNINKVFGSKILDTNSTLLVKRKIKTVLHHQRITRARKCLMVEEQQEEKMDEETPPKKKGLMNKMKMLTRAVRKTVLKKDDINKNDNNSDNSTSVNSSANTIKLRNTRNLKKGDSLDDTIQDIMDSIDAKDDVSKSEVSERSAEPDEESNSKTETTKKPKLMKKETVGAKLVRTFSLRKLRKKTGTEEEKLKTQSNPELDVKPEKVKNGKRKSTLDSFRNKIKKIKLKEKSITHIAQVDGSSQISDEILPFLEKININSDAENQDKNAPDFGENADEDPLGDCDQICDGIIPHEETNEQLTSTNREDDIADRYPTQQDRVTTPANFQTDEGSAEETTAANPCVIDTSLDIGEVDNTVALQSPVLQPSDVIKKEYDDRSVDHESTIDDFNKRETPIDLKACSSATKINKNKKRIKGLNDCIAMLTSKLQQKVDEQPVADEPPTKSITPDICSTPIVEKEILQKPVEADKPENTKPENTNQKRDQQHYVFTQNQFVDQQALLDINRKMFDWEHFEKQRQEYFNLQAKLLAEQQQLFLQQLQKQIPANHPYNYIPNIPRETGFLLNNIMMNNQNECAQKLMHLNQMDDLSKFITTMSRNNRFKEVDVNVDLLKYFGSIDNCVVKLEKLKNKNEGKKKTNNKASSARRYSNKRKENIEVMNDLKQQEPNKIIIGRPGDVDLNPAFLEGEEMKQKKFDAFKENDIVIDLKIKRTADIPHQTVLKPPDLQIKNDSIPKPPKVIEVSQMRSAGFGLNQAVHEAIDLKINKNAEIERQTNLLEQLSKNGVSIALFPCNQSNVKNCAVLPGNNEVMDLKITRKDDNKVLPVGLPKESDKINNRCHSHSLINLRTDQIVNNNVNITVAHNNVHPTTTHGFDKFGSISESSSVKNALMKPFANSVESTFVPVSLVPDQIKQLHDICAKNNAVTDPAPLKKHERKKRNTKSSKPKSDIVHHEQITQEPKLPVIETLQQNNEVIDLKVNKSTCLKAGEIKSLSDLKPIIPEFHQIDLKLFDTLHATHVNGSKTNIKTDKNRQIAEPSENQIRNNNKKDDKCGTVAQNATKEKKKFILKPPQFIATSLEKIPVIENLILPKVPTIAECLSFSVPENSFTQTHDIQKITKTKDSARSKNFESIEHKIKSFLLEEKEPDIMEEKLVERTCVRVPNLKACENLINQLNDRETLNCTKPIDDNQFKVSSKSDTDSEDDIPLANLLKECKKKGSSSENASNQTTLVENPPDQDSGAMMKEIAEQTHAAKTSSENQTQSKIFQDTTCSSIAEEETQTVAAAENKNCVTNLVENFSTVLEKENSNTVLQNNFQPILKMCTPSVEDSLLTIEKEHPLPTPGKVNYLPAIENMENPMPALAEEPCLPVPQNVTCLPNLNRDIALPVLPSSICLPISEIPTNLLAIEREAFLPPAEKESFTPILQGDQLPILHKDMCQSELADDNIVPTLSESSLENQAYIEMPAESSDFGQDATALNAILMAIDSKNKKVRGKKKTITDDKKEEPKKKPARRSKGSPLIDESEIDPLNKAARKIRISCQIFQKSCKIALDKNMIGQPEEEEEEDRVLTQLPTVAPMIEISLPDVFIKEELSTEVVLPIENPVQLLQNIKEEMPEIEEARIEEFPLPAVSDLLPESTPGLSAEDLELEIRRRIKLSNLQLKRENVEDSQAMPATIDTSIIYNVDSPEMPYPTEDNVMPIEYEHGLNNVSGTASNMENEVTIGNASFGNRTSIVMDAPPCEAIPNLYAVDHILALHNNLTHNCEATDGSSNSYNYDESKVPEPLINDSNDPIIGMPNNTVPFLTSINSNVVDNTNTSSTGTLDDPVENASPSTADLKTTAQTACLTNAAIIPNEGNLTEIDFDVEHEKEGDLPTETANTPNIEVLEEQKHLTKDVECKLKKPKKKHEEPTTDIPTYGEFQVNTDRTSGINKITLSRKKLPVKSESSEGFTEGGQNTGSLDIYEVKKVKRSHRKSISGKEKKKKKSDLSINEQNFENIIDNSKDTFSTNSDRVSTAFDDIFLDNVEFEVQNEEIGRRLKINKKKVKDVPKFPAAEEVTDTPVEMENLLHSISESVAIDEGKNDEIIGKLKINKKKLKDVLADTCVESVIEPLPIANNGMEDSKFQSFEIEPDNESKNSEIGKRLKISKKKAKESQETPVLEAFLDSSSLTTSTIEAPILLTEESGTSNQNRTEELAKKPKVTKKKVKDSLDFETAIPPTLERIVDKNDESSEKFKLNENESKDIPTVPTAVMVTDTALHHPDLQMDTSIGSTFEGIVHENRNNEAIKKVKVNKKKCRNTPVIPVLESMTDSSVTSSLDVEVPIISNFNVANSEESNNEEIKRKLRTPKKKIRDDSIAPILEAVSNAPIISNFEIDISAPPILEAATVNKSDVLTIPTDEEQKDYDDLPKDMEIEEFHVDIPIIETQFKSKFNTSIPNVTMDNSLNETPIKFTVCTKEATILAKHDKQQLDTFQFEVQELLDASLNGESKTALESCDKNLRPEGSKLEFMDTTTDPKLDSNCLDTFSLKNFYDENLTVKQNFTSNLNIISDCFSSTIQNDALMSGFDEIVSGNATNSLLEKSTPTKKSKKTKHSKLNAETSVNIEQSLKTVEEMADIIATHTTVASDQLSCSNAETEAKLNDDVSLPDDLKEVCVNEISSMNEKENRKTPKKSKNTKNSKTKSSSSNSSFIIPLSDTSAISSDANDFLKADIISTSTPQSSSSKKNKRTKTSKQTIPQQMEPSTFDIMCDELQALCDAPLTSLNQDQTQTPESNSKETEAIDDDLDFLNTSPSSFCNNIKTSCDAKIDELLREINFSPKPSKKSKKSKHSKKAKENPDNPKIDIKIVGDKSCDIESEINKTDENVDLDKSENIPVDVSNEISLPQNESPEDIEKLPEPVLENSNEKIATPTALTKPKPKSKSKKKSKAKQMKIPTVENTEAYCDICDKIFARNENLVKHKRTLTHIAKLSEIEARQAQVKVQENKEIAEQPPEEQQKVYKMDININDILNNAEKSSPDQKDISNEISGQLHINSPFILKTNSDTLKLVDIINDVLNKPVENEKQPSSYADSHLSQTSSSTTQGETKRYKSLGERKSFESDLKTTYPFNNMPVATDAIPKLPNTDSILKQQISILENIIETEGPFGYIDDITVSSNKSIEEPLPKSPSELSIMSETKHDDSNQLTFSHNGNAGNALVKSNIHSDTFLKPTQYEEISNDSSSVKNQFDDQRSRKVLNRDEELFLECCSLLKSSSEVSGYSKKSSKTVHVFNNFEMKQSDEPEWLEKKNFAKSQEYRHDMFSNSCPNTPLGDGYGEDYSNTNSNTIATDWSTKQREQQQENPVFEDISLDSKGSTNSKLDAEQYKQPKRTFGDFQLFNLDHQKNEDIIEASQANDENMDEKEVDEEFKKKMVSRFGGLMAKAWKASIQAVKKNKNKKKQETEINQTSITDYAVPINTNAKVDIIDANDSKKMLTKGAMKVFEGLKVSIPTDDLNMKELLNGSHSNKKPDEELNLESTELQSKESELIKEDIKTPKPNNIRSFGNRLGLKVTKKKYTIAKPLSKDASPVIKPSKVDEESKKSHDVYDFEETQDNVDIFNTKLTNIKEFRNQIAEKKTELCTVKELTPVEEVEESDSDDRRDIIDSFSYEAQSLSGISTGSLSSLKKPKKKNITKKKCMIMGRIFKNAFKSKIEEDIRDIPSVENSKLVEDYVMQLPSVEEKRTKLSEQEMDLLFDKLLEDKVPNKEETKKPVEAPPVTPSPVSVEKPTQAKGKSKNPPKRKRQRYNSESTDDEFSLSKNKKRYSKKKQKNVDNAINLEQELKECIGVASRKSQRKCTSGKQNVLVEFWSSDDSNFEAFLRETAAENSKGNDDLKDVEKIAKAVEPAVIAEDVEIPPPLTQESVKSDEVLKDVIKRPIHKSETENQKIPAVNPVGNKSEKVPTPKQLKRKSSNAKHRAKIADTDDKKMKNVRVISETLAANRRKRAASNTLYYWSSSSEDESQDLIEVKPVRDEIDEDEDRPMQHGWIVGDSPKKLVTMLAQAKGKKVDTESVKEQGKKRTTM